MTGETIDTSPADQHSEHSLQMSGRGVFYSFSFDLGPDLDIIALADELLRKDMAAGAASPSDDGIRIPKRGVVLDREQAHAHHMHEFLSVLFSGDFSWRELFRHNRRMTLTIVWIHRFQLLRFYIHRVLFGQSPHKVVERSDEIKLPKWVTEAQAQMNDISDSYADMLFHDHILGAARIRLEQSLYFPGYVDTGTPYLRIEMNRAYFTDQNYTNEPIEISLMAHISGICILTFAMPIAKNFGVSEAFNYMQVGKRGIKRFEISNPIMGDPDEHISLIETDVLLSTTSHGNLEWFCAQIPSAQQSSKVFTVDQIFVRYWDAITRAAGQKIETSKQSKANRLPGWNCHTTLFQGSPSCSCNASEAKSVHSMEFGQIMTRASVNMPIQDAVRDEFLKNHLLESERELWLAPGHSIHTIWNEHEIDYISDLRIIIPIEFTILQHRQLQAIDHRTVQTQVRDEDLFSAQEQLATGLPEYGRILLADQNSPRIIRALSDKLQTPDLYRRLNDRVKVLESIVNTRFSRMQSKRSLALSIIGAAIVLSLLLPRVTELTGFLAKLTPAQSIINHINDFFGTGNATVLAIYCLIVLMAIVFFTAFPARPEFRMFRRRNRSFGYPTRGGLELTTEYDGDDETDSDSN